MQTVICNLKMTYEKLTYSRKDCNNYLYFSFHSDFFDTEVVTKELGLKPTSLIIKKDPVPKTSSWKYKIEAGNEIDLETPLKKLVEIFEPKIETINRLKKDLNLASRLQFVIDIDISPEASTPYFGLDKRTIDFLSNTATEVDFDLYKADSLGLLKNEQNCTQ
ncbi:DUF4279 domain-containing protein [Leeuwenhoekiella sp. H156]|uniref:DUF4279 domain-containing protein n=1 Tax=Leeuwenhoekiella sp. H156 TaxID=3450128 RepID=UPI003FA49D75